MEERFYICPGLTKSFGIVDRKHNCNRIPGEFDTLEAAVKVMRSLPQDMIPGSLGPVPTLGVWVPKGAPLPEDYHFDGLTLKKLEDLVESAFKETL